MTDNDEAGGSHTQEGQAHAYLDFLAAQEKQGWQDPLVMTDDDGGGAGADTDATNTGTETGPDDVANDSTEGGTSQASEGKKAKRARRPNELGTGRLVVTAVHPGDFEPVEPREVAACYGNQLACILRDTANINTTKIRKNEHLKQLLLTRLHARFLFPGRKDDVDPWKDDAMKKINNKALGKFSNALSAWKTRVKKAIEVDHETYAEIVADNPTIMLEDFEKFKATCNEEAAKARSERGKQLQAKNMGNHRLGSRGYTGKRPVWAKEDAERERLGIPDPLAEFTDQQEHDFIRARFSWDPKKRFFSPTGRLGNS
jgi:hypothetical protein